MTMPSKFEVHYFLKNNSHSMNAALKNRCEAELLAIALEVISELDLNITINSEALKEGGIRDVWSWIGGNSKQITAISAIITVALLYSNRPDSELTDLDKKLKTLQIQELENNLKSNNISDNSSFKIIEKIQKNTKITTRVSHFYKALKIKNQEVYQVGFSSLDENYNLIGKENIIPREDFHKFILRSNKLPLEVIEDAEIEIVAPVLKEGKAKWKGIFLEEFISFEMNDSDFKASVIAKEVSFRNGDRILCVLQIHKELSDTGEIIISKRSVQVVLDKITNNNILETKSGKKYRRNKEFESDQIKLDI